MKVKKDRRKDADQENTHAKAFTWGMISAGLGVIVILLALLIEVNYHPAGAGDIGLKLIEHLGIAAIVLGVVSIIVEFRDWQEYFQKRLADIVIERKYLNTLDREKLLELQTDTLKAYFRDEDIDRKDSFLDFFRTKLQNHIGSPYREGSLHTITLEPSGERGFYEVEETRTIRFRKVRDSILDRVGYETYGDSLIQLKDFSASITIPDNFYQAPDFGSKYPQVKERTLSFETELKDGELIPQSSALQPATEGQGFYIPLTEFKDIDGLVVELRVKYTIPVNVPLSFTAVAPHKGLKLIISYPKNYTIDVTIFGVDENNYHQDDRVGLYVFEYDSWLLPNSGYSYYLRERATD